MVQRDLNYDEDPNLPRPLSAPHPIIGVDFTGCRAARGHKSIC